MKHLSKNEIKLFENIKEQKSIINFASQIKVKFGKYPINDFNRRKDHLLKLIKQVNEFEPIGEIETLEQAEENKRFIRWYNTLNEYKKTKENENLK